MFDLFKLSLQNLSRRKLRAYLTMIGIFIGIAAVVALIGLGEGLRMAITAQFGFLGSDVLSVQASGMGMAGPPGTGAAEPLNDDLAKDLAKIPGVDTAINRYIKSGTLEFKDSFGIGFATNVPNGENRKTLNKLLNIKIGDGRNLKDGDTRKAVLGYNFKDKDGFGVNVGDTILLQDKYKYEVVGIMEKKGSFIFDGMVLINEEQLLKDFDDDGTVNVIAVKVQDEKEIAKVKERVEKFLRKERDVKEGEENFAVESPQSTLDSLNSTLFAVQLFVIMIASISLLVGGIGITNTMYTAVLERTKEIGIMKSIGATNFSIFRLFFYESGLLGLVGGGIGILIGLALAYGLAAVGRVALGGELIQAHVSPLLLIGALSFSFFVGVAAGLLPAYQASRKHPVDALRFAK